MANPVVSLSAWNRYRAGLALARADREAAAKAERHLDCKVGNKIILTKRRKPYAYVISHGEAYEYDRFPES